MQRNEWSVLAPQPRVDIGSGYGPGSDTVSVGPT